MRGNQSTDIYENGRVGLFAICSNFLLEKFANCLSHSAIYPAMNFSTNVKSTPELTMVHHKVIYAELRSASSTNVIDCLKNKQIIIILTLFRKFLKIINHTIR
jgi:hypothetical protein